MSEKFLETSKTIVDLDAYLEPYQGSIEFRRDHFFHILSEIERNYGSMENFVSWYKHMGFHWEGDEFIYREWAPMAKQLYLVGDFNNWSHTSDPLTRTENGIWEFRCNANRMKHGSEVKVCVESDIGTHDRLPLFIHYAVQNSENHSFNGVLWNPPQKFEWSDEKFRLEVKNPLIYECHVGMATEDERVGSFREFADNILPYVADIGYNVIQVMAVMEHPYYGSFGYHVSNFYAVSSRFGTPHDFKYLVNKAHSLGLAVIIDLVHSHAVKNFHEGLNMFDGTDYQFFHSGPKGYHTLWDSMLFNYAKQEVQRFLLSNVAYWLEEYHVDGYRFDGITSMLYHHHGHHKDFGHYDMYFNDDVDQEALLYLQLANHVAHINRPEVLTVAEDMSGMPGLCRPMEEGGIGFDYRLAMGVPDNWIKILKEKSDEEWQLEEIYQMLVNRRYAEKSIAYCESHDQALVGDKTIAFRLMDQEMYWHMHKDSRTPIIDRGIALHKLIRFFTAVLGGEGYLTFIGNEFGHPEWIDFPREGNNFSYKYARRQWSLKNNPQLLYKHLLAWEKNILQFISKYDILEKNESHIVTVDVDNKVIVFEKAGLLFVFSFNPLVSIPSYRIGVSETGTYKIVLCSDILEFGGFDRVDTKLDYTAQNIPMHGRNNSLELYVTNRTAIVCKKSDKE